MTFHCLNSHFLKLSAADRPFLICYHVLFGFLCQRNTQGHPANMLQLGINSSNTTCQRDGISLSRRGETLLHIAVPSSLGCGWGVMKAEKQLVKDRERGAKTKARALTCWRGMVACSSPLETRAVSSNPWAGRAVSYTWPCTKPTDVLGHYTSWP